MKIKRLFAVLTLTASLMTVSCANAATLMKFIPEDQNTTDFDGTVIQWGWNKGGPENGFYEVGTPQYDYLLERLNIIETERNCIIELTHGSVNMESTQIKMMSGTPSYDILTSKGISELAAGGLLYSLSDLTDHIDIGNTAKFGPLTSQEGYMYRGKVYGATFAHWPGFEHMVGHVIAYNRDLFKENNITDFHEFYENGNWTYDTFEQEFIAAVNIQDKEGKAMKIWLANETNLYEALVHSNQVQFVEKKADGTLVANPYSKSFVNAMTWGENLIETYRDKISFEDSTKITSYRNQSILSALTYTAAFTTGNIAYNDLSEFESGVMPFPCGPDATYGEWTSCIGNIYGFMIPITTLKVEAAATVMNDLAEPFEAYGGDAGLFEYYKNNIFMNPLDAEIFIEVSKHTSYTYETVAGNIGKEVCGGFSSTLKNSQVSVTESLEKYRDVLTELIEEWMIPNYEAVYGN